MLNRSLKMLHYIMNAIHTLGGQSLAIRGKYKSDCLKEASGELDSNLVQLLKVHAEEKPNLTKRMEKNQDKFTSPSIQNEMIFQFMTLKQFVK